MLKDKQSYTAFHYAVAGGNHTGLDYLLSSVGSFVCLHGNDMPKLTPLHLAVSKLFSVEDIKQRVKLYKGCSENK